MKVKDNQKLTYIKNKKSKNQNRKMIQKMMSI